MNLSEILRGNPPTKENLLLYIGYFTGVISCCKSTKAEIEKFTAYTQREIVEKRRSLAKYDYEIHTNERKLKECQFALFLIEGKYVKTRSPSGEEL